MTDAAIIASVRRTATAMVDATWRYGLAAGGSVTLVSVMWGVASVVTSAITTVVIVASFCVGPLVMRAVAASSASAVMAAAVGGYAAVGIALTVLFVLLNDVAHVRPYPAAAVIIGVALIVPLGQMRALRRSRILAYDGDREAANGS
jgi:hypothetical protein